jgi:phage baseplate assembly protein W
MGYSGYQATGGGVAHLASGQPGDLRSHRHAFKYSGDTATSKGNVMELDYPFHFNNQGHTAATSGDEYTRDLIEQVLFTSPGERVNRPTFGSGLLQLLFGPNSEPLAAATQLSVQGALQQWVGDLIQVESVVIQSEDSTLRVLVQYTIRRSQQRQVAQFSREI